MRVSTSKCDISSSILNNPTPITFGIVDQKEVLLLAKLELSY